MSGVSFDVEAEWNDIVKTMIEPLEGYLNGKDASLKGAYIKVYTKAYQICMSTDTNALNLYDKCVNRIEHYLESVVMVSLQQMVQKGEPLMEEFKRRKDNHDLMMNWYSAFFSYFKTAAAKFHKPSLLEQGARLYKNVVFVGVSGAIAETIVGVMELKRQGMLVDISVLKGCIKIFHDFKVYDELLEPSVVARSREDFAKKGKEWIDTDSTSDFLHKVQREIDSVMESTAVYLPATTQPKLLNTIDKELLSPYVHTLAEKDTGALFLLQHDKLDDLALMFALYSNVMSAPVISDHLRVYLTSVLSSFVREFTDAVGQAAEKEAAENAIVVKLIETHEKYFALVNSVLGQAAHAHKAVRDSFLSALGGEQSRAIVEALCVFVDKLMRKKATPEEEKEFELKFYGVITMLSFVTEKDYFVEVFRAKLSRRLLTGTVTNSDLEKSMVGKLKISLGGQITLRLEGMLNDISSAIDVMPLFREAIKEEVPLEVKALTLNNWPSMVDLPNLVFPPQMRYLIDKFTAFYNYKFPERRLIWIHSQGSLELRGAFGSKRYTLDVSPPQALLLLSCETPIVLAQKGANAVFAFAELLKMTGMAEDVLKKVLHSLSCGKFKILKRISKGEESKAIKNTDKFQINEKFASPQLKFKVPMPSLESNAKLEKDVEDNRKYQIEAAVVRIMKARKILNHQSLVSEVLGQLALFRPDPKMVKKCIESLIDREYLRRDETEGNKYHYVA